MRENFSHSERENIESNTDSKFALTPLQKKIKALYRLPKGKEKRDKLFEIKKEAIHQRFSWSKFSEELFRQLSNSPGINKTEIVSEMKKFAQENNLDFGYKQLEYADHISKKLNKYYSAARKLYEKYPVNKRNEKIFKELTGAKPYGEIDIQLKFAHINIDCQEIEDFAVLYCNDEDDEDDIESQIESASKSGGFKRLYSKKNLIITATNPDNDDYERVVQHEDEHVKQTITTPDVPNFQLFQGVARMILSQNPKYKEKIDENLRELRKYYESLAKDEIMAYVHDDLKSDEIYELFHIEDEYSTEKPGITPFPMWNYNDYDYLEEYKNSWKNVWHDIKSGTRKKEAFDQINPENYKKDIIDGLNKVLIKPYKDNIYQATQAIGVLSNFIAKQHLINTFESIPLHRWKKYATDYLTTHNLIKDPNDYESFCINQKIIHIELDPDNPFKSEQTFNALNDEINQVKYFTIESWQALQEISDCLEDETEYYYFTNMVEELNSVNIRLNEDSDLKKIVPTVYSITGLLDTLLEVNIEGMKELSPETAKMFIKTMERYYGFQAIYNFMNIEYISKEAAQSLVDYDDEAVLSCSFPDLKHIDQETLKILQAKSIEDLHLNHEIRINCPEDEEGNEDDIDDIYDFS